MMSSGVEGIASKIGGEMADGNISFDNQSFHNQTVSGRQIAQQQLGSNFNYGSSLNDGKMTLSTSMDGLQTVSVMQSTLTSNLASNDNLQASINDNYTKSQQLMENAARTYMKSTSDTASELLNFTNRLSHGVGITEGMSSNASTEMRKNAEQTLGDLKSFSKKHNISEQTAAEMALRVNAGGGMNLGFVKVGLDGSAGISSNAQNQHIYDSMKNSDEGRRLSEGIGDLLQHAKQSSSSINDQAAQDASRSFQGAYATMTQASEQFQKAYTQSENWSHAKSLSDTKGISLTTNENEAYLNYVASKRFGGDIMQAAHYVESNPHNVEQSEFMDNRKAAFASWVSDANHILSDGEIQSYLGSINQTVGSDSLSSTQHHMDQANLKSEESLLKDIDLMGSEIDKNRGSNAAEIRDLRYELEQKQATQQNNHHQQDQKMNITRMASKSLGDLKNTWFKGDAE
ncbi:MAG: hypothetical protein F9K49_03875 [Caedimonadaceae bacterium]|nr:MAG: hypothetical protein F9K49_03875 [Caedimonadaceae bacterium]